MSERDESASASLSRLVDLETADLFGLGWKEMVMIELDRMRADMPYADTLEIRLTCERRRDSIAAGDEP